MGRPRKPTKVLELRGSFRKNPQRKKEREHEPESLGPLAPAPARLSESQQARYEQLRGWCPWLGAEHQPLVERTAVIWTRLIDGTDRSSDEKQFTQNLSKLGMTPTDSSKVWAPKAKPKSKLEKFAS